MCGLAGGITRSNLSEFEIKNIGKLLFLNSGRGQDSTGIYDYIINPPVETSKPLKGHKYNSLFWKLMKHPAMVAEENFINSLADKSFRWSKVKPCYIGIHTRSATVGHITKENAHPFQKGTIIGAHNGTISGFYPGKDKYETDSEALYSLIAEVGLEKALEEFYSKATTVAYALAFIDTKEQTLTLARNHARPLHIYHTATTTYYSSDAWDLQYAFKITTPITNLSLTSIKKGEKATLAANTLYCLPPNFSLTFKLGGDPLEAIVNTLPVAATPTYTYQRGADYEEYSEYYSSIYGANNNRFKRIQHQEKKEEKNVVVLPRQSSKLLMPTHWFSLTEAGIKNISYANLSQHACFYALEFDAYFSLQQFQAVLIWRANNQKRFAELLAEKYNMYAADTRRKILEDAGLSKKLFNKLIKGKTTQFVYSPRGKKLEYTIGKPMFGKEPESGINIEFKDVKEYLLGQRKTASSVVKEMKEELNDEVPFDKQAKEERDKTTNGGVFLYGPSSKYRLESFSDYSAKKERGCRCCLHKSNIAERIWWLNKDDYLCEECQIMSEDLLNKKEPSIIPDDLVQQFLEFRRQRANPLFFQQQVCRGLVSNLVAAQFNDTKPKLITVH